MGIWRKNKFQVCSTRFAHSDPSTVLSTFDWDQFAKIRQHSWKGRLKVSNDAKFERDLLITHKDMAPQSRRILQRFVWWG